MPLTFEQFIQLAKEWYRWGGDSFVECWDEAEFIKAGPITKTKAKKMFRDNYYDEKEYIATMFA